MGGSLSHTPHTAHSRTRHGTSVIRSHATSFGFGFWILILITAVASVESNYVNVVLFCGMWKKLSVNSAPWRVPSRSRPRPVVLQLGIRERANRFQRESARSAAPAQHTPTRAREHTRDRPSDAHSTTHCHEPAQARHEHILAPAS